MEKYFLNPPATRKQLLAMHFKITLRILLVFLASITGPISADTDVTSEQVEKYLNERDIKTVSFWSFNYIYPNTENSSLTSISLASAPSIWPRVIEGFGMPDIKSGPATTFYVVKRGDTLSGLAKRYGVTIKTLKDQNKLRGSLIRIGQKLVIKRGNQGKRVKQFETSYKNNLKYVTRIFNRSQKYIHYILGELEKRNMPTELALLPMIESAYYPVAYSRAHAAGLWQFIPSTGKNYGLIQNWWRDDRRDVMASTRAALDYLEVLHNEFNDWQLVLAAYNWGENGLRRSIKRNQKQGRGTTYFDLRMPSETRNYVPKLQAIKNIVLESHTGSLNLPHVADYPYFTPVAVPSLIDINVAAKLAEIDLEEFEMLNPSHNRPVYTGGTDSFMLIPTDRVNLFKNNLENIESPVLNWGTYTFKKGDTLSQTAERFSISLEKLRAINGLRPYVPIQEGRSVLIPWPSSLGLSNLEKTWTLSEFNHPSSLYGKEFVYRIKRGDTLSGIAKRYGVSIKAIKTWNKLRSNMIRVGKKLVIYKDLSVPRVSKMLEG